MQRRIEAHAPAGRRFICIAPCVEQPVGFRQEQTFIGYPRHFPIQQACAHVADLTQADAGSLGERGDAPGAGRVAQHHAQYLRGFRLEQRFERASLGGRLARHEAFDEHTAEDKPGIAFEIQKTDLMRAAQRLRLDRQIGRDQNRRRFAFEMVDIAAQLKRVIRTWRG